MYVNYTISPGSICIACYYITGNTKDKDKGCEVNLFDDVELQYVRRFTKITDEKAEGCINNISTGIYHIYIYNIGSINTYTSVDVEYYKVFIPSVFTSSPSMPLLTSTTPYTANVGGK